MMAAGLVACGGRPPPLAPVAVGTTKTAKIDMLVATTREASPNQGVLFNGERGSSLSYANVVVSIPPDRKPGTVQWPRQVPGDPAHDFVTTAVEPLKFDQIRPWFRQHETKSRRVLIFVHGFNTPFDASVFRFAQIAHDADANVAPVLFSWPSRGNLLDYNYDRESANFSRSDLAKVIEAASNSPDVSDVIIMAHSMGSWVAMEALRQITFQRGRISPKVSNVILASPDLDIDVFRKQVLEIGPKRPHFTIFVSTNDRALRISRLISGSVTRVGAVDLNNDQYMSQLKNAAGITVIDLSELQDGDRLNHSQFATSPEVVQLLGSQLLDGSGVDRVDMDGSGQLAATAVGTGQVLGSAAGAVLSAPVRIFQANGRY